jgi:DNA-binding transcriptional regulator LsrR (DeoR family)
VSAFEIIRDLAQQKEPGPASQLTEVHFIKAISVLGERMMGRKALSEELGIGEGAVRTLLKRLVGGRLVRISRSGCSLTREGEALHKKLREVLPRILPVKKSAITTGERNIGVLVRGVARQVKRGLEQRDAAVRAGASGAVIILFRQGRLSMPGVTRDLGKDYPEAAEQVMKLFQPAEEDVIIIGGADDEEIARNGAIAAALTLF